ncbi:NAD-dependent epimerase/dehydratase family protein [Paracoccus aurantiacus]|uniref:NAD-dependent epimerase/dehydratase family protein n=1 Tax=Paracoccus aurantiacus TaxID=2599412 RepID=UPI003635038A
MDEGMQYPQAILVTGAAGNLGRVVSDHLIEALRAGRISRLRLTDMQPLAEVEGVETIQTQLTGREVAFDLAEGMDAIIHLSGIPVEGEWDALIPSNLAATAHLWDAAVAHGVDRILFASSNHAVGLYPVDEAIDHSAAPRPDSRYGLTKAFGEQLGALYAAKTPVRAFCMRIGTCAAAATARRHLQTYQSFDDFLRLIDTGLTADYRFEIVYGISDNEGSFWDNTNARRLGYAPQDKPADFMKEPVEQTDYRFQGGNFADAPLGKS